MTILPEPTPTAPAAGQAANPLEDAVIRAAVDNAIHEARRQDASPRAVIGNTPPVTQPGRPAMSEKATDDSVRMIAAGFLTLCAGGATSGVLYFSGQADPEVIAWMAVAPVGLAVPIFALSRLVKRAKPEPDVHHHYNGTVIQDQRETHTKNTGLWARTNNQQ
ncbi:hypothetical protein JL475_00380 [Streptomyces sp. M2CJ-2]|uniref:hypothetical protein n=1 Tax=Streptomyces sp. M2CJ-2 TaxID=2803948 RepID=UPI001923BD4E|nr:hypothetical protein [Streptomyces sp. M2CJ-2]MBL3664502.1 hypothetical protein [Streptomyces sp. M2CJ-2]